MYRAFIKKEGPVTTEEILAIHEALSVEVYGKPVEVQVRSSALDPLHAKQYRNFKALSTLSHKEIEGLRSADIFLINISMWINDSYTQVHLRGLGDRGRNIILVACYEDGIYILVKKVLERIFPNCYIDDQQAAIAASEKLDAETWDPDMDDDGEDGALEALRAMQ